MIAKLTLTIEDDVIEKTKKYAASTGSSLSKMVENYFRSLIDEESKTPKSKRLQKLKGIIPNDGNVDYKEILKDGLTDKYDS
jgi:hypothetical protein